MIRDRLIVGTRGSALARRQTELVSAMVRAHWPGLAIDVIIVETRGDRVQDQPISVLGDKGVFVRAIERALLDGEIDLAVHSLKDVPADFETEGLQLVAFPPREDARDVVVGPAPLHGLPPGAVIGTGSARRRLQLGALRPDLHFAEIRGNVDTRLRKLDEGQYEALILAAAGLRRLGLEGRIAEYLATDTCVPDAGQGVMAVQARRGDAAGAVAARINDPAAAASALVERAVVRGLRADCHSPVGVHAVATGAGVEVTVVAGNREGTRIERARRTLLGADLQAQGYALGEELFRLLGA